jgi:hypothetical protein
MVQRRKGPERRQDSQTERRLLQGQTEWALWRLSLTLREIAGRYMESEEQEVNDICHE